MIVVNSELPRREPVPVQVAPAVRTSWTRIRHARIVVEMGKLINVKAPTSPEMATGGKAIFPFRRRFFLHLKIGMTNYFYMGPQN